MRNYVVSARRAFYAAGRYTAGRVCRAVAAAGVAATVFATSGCYSFVEMPLNQVSPNTTVSADITDAGRVNLGGRVGAEAARVEGKVVQKSDSGVTLLVSRVQYLNGLGNDWQGQEVQLTSQDIKSVSTRTFSRAKTAVLAAFGAAAVVVMATTGFLGFLSGNPGSDKGGPEPGEQ